MNIKNLKLKKEYFATNDGKLERNTLPNSLLQKVSSSERIAIIKQDKTTRFGIKAEEDGYIKFLVKNGKTVQAGEKIAELYAERDISEIQNLQDLTQCLTAYIDNKFKELKKQIDDIESEIHNLSEDFNQPFEDRF